MERWRWGEERGTAQSFSCSSEVQLYSLYVIPVRFPTGICAFFTRSHVSGYSIPQPKHSYLSNLFNFFLSLKFFSPIFAFDALKYMHALKFLIAISLMFSSAITFIALNLNNLSLIRDQVKIYLYFFL